MAGIDAVCHITAVNGFGNGLAHLWILTHTVSRLEPKVNEARGIVFPHLVAAGLTQLIAAGNIRIDERHLTGAERGRRLLLLRHRCQRDLF